MNEISSRPLIFYIDDEPRNLTVFETSMPDEWDVKCFDKGADALKMMRDLKPNVIVSDQRMPHMSGLEILELAEQLAPEAMRMIVTGQTAEDVITQLIRRAHIFDYVTKPWNTGDLLARLSKAIEFNRALVDRRLAHEALEKSNKEMTVMLNDLRLTTQELLLSKEREEKVRRESIGWSPWAIAEALKRGALHFPLRQQAIFCLCFDIIRGTDFAGTKVDGRMVRSQVIRLFRDKVLQYGGMNESQAGDACYAHFGAFDLIENPAQAALSAAREFRVALRSFASKHRLNLECGVGLHHVEDAEINQDTMRVMLADNSERVEKTLHTASPGIDLVHRIEKLAHSLPGSNILISQQFMDLVDGNERRVTPLAKVKFERIPGHVSVYMLPSDLTTPESVATFINSRHWSVDSLEPFYGNEDQLVKPQTIQAA